MKINRLRILVGILFFTTICSANNYIKDSLILNYNFSKVQEVSILVSEGTMQNEPAIVIFINNFKGEMASSVFSISEFSDIKVLTRSADLILCEIYDSPTGQIFFVLINESDDCIYKSSFFDSSYSLDLSDLDGIKWECLTGFK